MAQMCKWETDQDGIDNMRLTTGPIPDFKEEHVLVKINAVSLNYRDTEGTGQPHRPTAIPSAKIPAQSSWASMDTTSPSPRPAQ